MVPDPKHAADWELAPKLDVAAHVLVKDDSDQVGHLFLGLALAFNDLKGLVLFERHLLALGRPGGADWGENAGQWRGIAVQIYRWIAGVLHEVMVLIEKHKMVLRSAEVKALVALLSPARSTKWTEFTDAALKTNGTVHILLLRIRNSTAFHYDAKSLRNGFKKQFLQDAKDQPTEANRAPQFSAGSDMDGTRFYYADAAAQQAMSAVGLLFGAPETDRAVIELAADFNDAVAPLLITFIRQRQADADRHEVRSEPSGPAVQLVRPRARTVSWSGWGAARVPI